jgi:FkbM family methyltransferase
MFERLHGLGSTIRHSRLMSRQDWLWRAVEPTWQQAFARLSRGRGFTTSINEDVFQLDYAIGSRYARHGHGAYEPSFYQPFVDRVKSGMVVFDIGAHVGLFTLGAAKRVGPRGRVFAFEPAPATFALLVQQIRLNGWNDRVEAIRGVVSDVDGRIPFYAHGTSMAASLSRENLEVLNPERFATPAARLEVASMTIDGLCLDRKVAPDVVKIDVEGAELRVLRGAADLLEVGRVVILCEIHPQQMANCGSSVAELGSFLEKVGYSIQRLDEPNPMGIFHALLQKHK